MNSNISAEKSPGQSGELGQVEDTTGMVTEYQALRSEILKRIEFRYQLINLILIVAGTFLTVGLQPNISASMLLVYPILALFLVAGWVHNGVATLRIARYIRKKALRQKQHGSPYVGGWCPTSGHRRAKIGAPVLQSGAKRELSSHRPRWPGGFYRNAEKD